MDSVNKYGKSKRKPNVVHIYNSHMSGIDQSDQMLPYHSALQKTVRWYKKVGIHIMEFLLSNAYYMYAGKEHERFPRINSNKLDWSSSSKPPFEATSILPPPLYYKINRKKEKCCQSM